MCRRSASLCGASKILTPKRAFRCPFEPYVGIDAQLTVGEIAKLSEPLTVPVMTS
jgi:hypothetical protein